ncbi:MAG: right-handed parallel beta-helix repeat-containing protein, partial [Rhodospirillales bacterium]|nr:right-handed parallel beta-helix repeat-containing protein [Rhodospirillales bacterium]
HDNPRGSQGFLSARLRLPLDLFAGGGGRKLTARERRMADPIVRDIDVVTQAGAYGASEIVTQLASGAAFTVLNSATTTGNDLDTAVTAAGASSTVILSGTFQVTTGNTISLANAQTLTGTATVRNAAGRTATLSTGAAVHGTNVAGSTVQVNSNGTLSGLTITNAYNDGSGGRAVLVAGGAGGVTIANNTISTSQSGANGAGALTFSAGASGTISGNTLTATGSGTATTMTALGINSGATTVTVTGNSLSASGGTANNMASVGAATINAGSTGNTRGSGTCDGAPTSGSIGFTNGTTCP